MTFTNDGAIASFVFPAELEAAEPILPVLSGRRLATISAIYSRKVIMTMDLSKVELKSYAISVGIDLGGNLSLTDPVSIDFVEACKITEIETGFAPFGLLYDLENDLVITLEPFMHNGNPNVCKQVVELSLEVDGDSPPNYVQWDEKTMTITISGEPEVDIELSLVGEVPDFSLRESLDFTVTVQMVTNSAPTISPSVSELASSLGEVTVHTLTVTDSEFDEFTITCTTSDPFISCVDSGLGTILIQVVAAPTEEQLGDYDIQITLTDSNAEPMSAVYDIVYSIAEVDTADETESAEEGTAG